MNSQLPKNWQLHQLAEEDLKQLPSKFAEAVAKVKNFALEEFDREIAQKLLYSYCSLIFIKVR